MASITLYELSQYNNGILRPLFIELDPLSSREEYLEAIGSALESMMDEDEPRFGYRPLYEEWIVCDYDDVPHAYVGEYDLRDDYWEYKAAREAAHWLDDDVFQSGAELDIPPNEIADSYFGEYDTDEDFGYSFAEACGVISRIPEELRSYFDFGRYAHDLLLSEYRRKGRHYFRIY